MRNKHSSPIHPCRGNYASAKGVSGVEVNIGLKVRLKGRGYSPGMVVEKVEVKGKPDYVECRWYSSKEGKFVVESFHKDTLELDTGKSAAVGRKRLEGPY